MRVESAVELHTTCSVQRNLKNYPLLLLTLTGTKSILVLILCATVIEKCVLQVF